MTFFAGDFLTADLIAAAFAALFQDFADKDSVAAGQVTSSNVYGDLGTVGPSVTITSTGTVAVALWSATQFSAETATNAALMSVAVSGDTTVAASDGAALVGESNTTGNAIQRCQFEVFTINPGTNTYTCKYRSESNTVDVTHSNRRLWVIAP